MCDYSAANSANRAVILMFTKKIYSFWKASKQTANTNLSRRQLLIRVADFFHVQSPTLQRTFPMRGPLKTKKRQLQHHSSTVSSRNKKVLRSVDND